MAASLPQQGAQHGNPASERTNGSDLKHIAAALEKLPQASHPDTGCNQGKDNRKSDLCAQWKAADAAKESADWTRRTFKLSVAGLVVGFLTLAAAAFAAWYARHAAIETKRSADFAGRMAFDAPVGIAAAVEANNAMREANTIAKDNSHRELRAYLSAKSLTIEKSEWDDDKFSLFISIANHGQTPAVVQKIVFKAFWVFDGGCTVLIEYDQKTIFKCHRDTPVQFPFSFNGAFENCDDSGHVFVVGRIDYRDAFGKNQKDSFGWQTPSEEYGPFYDIDLPAQFHSYSLDSALALIKERRGKKDSGK